MPYRRKNYAHKSRSSSPKWRRVYYLLAACDVLIVLFSLFLNYQILRIYNQSAQSNRLRTERRNDMDELGRLVSEVNAPGNKVFESLDVEAQSLRMTAALGDFNQLMVQVETDLLRQASQPELGDAFAQADVEVLPTHLGEIGLSMSQMTDEAGRILSYFQQRKPETTGSEWPRWTRSTPTCSTPSGACAPT